MTRLLAISLLVLGGCSPCDSLECAGAVRSAVSDGTTLYWEEAGGGSALLHAHVIASGRDRRLASVPLGDGATGVHLAGGAIAWNAGCSLWRTLLSDGETAAMDTQGCVGATTVAGDFGYFSAAQPGPNLWVGAIGAAQSTILVGDRGASSLAATGRDLYWIEQAQNGRRVGLRRTSLDEGDTITLADDPLASSVAVDPDRLYYASSDGRLLAAPLSGGPFVMLSDQLPAGEIHELTAHPSGLYWCDAQRVWRLPSGATQPEMIADEGRPIASIAVDDRAVYWIAGGTLAQRAHPVVEPWCDSCRASGATSER